MTLKFITTILLLFSFTTTVYSANEKSTFTKDLHSLPTNANIKKLSKYLKDTKVVFIRGLAGNIIYKLNLSEYYSKQIAWLKTNNISVELIQTRTQDTIEVNSKIIADYINKQDQSLILIAHSKGGLGLIHTLIKYPKIIKKINSIITIQSPHKGTKIASYVLDNMFFKYLTKIFAFFSGGSLETIREITPLNRSNYLEKHKDKILKITNETNWINITTSITNKVSWKLRILKNIYDKKKIVSDGVVPTKSMKLPSFQKISEIYINEVDHIDTVGLNSSCCIKQYFDRIKFIYALLNFVSTKPQNL